MITIIRMCPYPHAARPAAVLMADTAGDAQRLLIEGSTVAFTPIDRTDLIAAVGTMVKHRLSSKGIVCGAHPDTTQSIYYWLFLSDDDRSILE